MSRNRFQAKCYRCGLPVAAERGYVQGKNDRGGWRVTHDKCIPAWEDRK